MDKDKVIHDLIAVLRHTDRLAGCQGNPQDVSLAIGEIRSLARAALERHKAYIPTYKSKAAQEAQSSLYGGSPYWEYLDNQAEELFAKGIPNAFTRTLAEALQGNDGD